MTAKTTDFSGLLFYNPAGPGFDAVPQVTIHCPDSMDEGSRITVNLVTWDIPDGTVLRHVFPLYGTNLTGSRFNVSPISPVSNNRASFFIEVSADHTTSLDGQSFDIVIKKTLTGPALATKYGVNVNDTSLTPAKPTGLIRRAYNGYFYTGAEASQWFKDRMPIDTLIGAPLGNGDPGEVHVQYLSYEWVGYFSPPATDDYTFYINSDDYTLVWIGSNAVSAYTNSNADITCATSQYAQSSAISLTGGDFVPIRIQFGNNTGGGELHVSWSSTQHPTPTRNFDWLIYHDTPPILNLVARNTGSWDHTGTTWYDLTSNHYDATIVGGPTYSNNGMVLDGDAQYAVLPPGTYFIGDFTIVAWVYLNSYAQWSRIIDFGDGAEAENLVIFSATDGTSGEPAMRVGGTQFTANEQIPLGAWTQVVARMSGTHGRIFINGQQVGHHAPGPWNTMVPAIDSVRQNCFIAHSNYAGDADLNGSIGELQIYNYALSDSDIQGNYDDLSSLYTSSPTYELTTQDSVTSVDEGVALTFNVTTTNVADGTDLYFYWTNTGTYDISPRFSDGCGSAFTITGNAGTFTLTVAADNTTATGSQSYDVVLATTPPSDPLSVVGNTVSITVNDTSQTPANITYPDPGGLNGGLHDRTWDATWDQTFAWFGSHSTSFDQITYGAGQSFGQPGNPYGPATARLEGYFAPTQAGSYTFTLVSDNSAWAWVGNNVATASMANSNLSTGGITSITVSLVPGDFYPILVVYTQGSNGPEQAGFTLFASGTGITGSINSWPGDGYGWH